jgi:hypothetical protein
MSLSLADSILRYHDPSQRPAARPGRTEPAGSDWGATVVREEVAWIRSLLGEVSREWSDLLADVAELKRTMRPEDLEAAFASAGLPALFRKEPAKAGGRRRAERAHPLETTERAPGPEVQARILEILALLRESAGEEAGGKAAARIAKPAGMERAREVAGKVRDSLTLPVSGGEAAGSRRSATPARPIPLDDVNAMIDQISGLG